MNPHYRLKDMKIPMPYEEELRKDEYSTVNVFRTELPDTEIACLFRKNCRMPWEPSVLEGIRINLALRELRERDLMEVTGK